MNIISMIDALLTRWVFSHITPISFVWRNIVSNDDGATWEIVQEMAAQRVSVDDTNISLAIRNMINFERDE
jgi:hypothetical protein